LPTDGRAGPGPARPRRARRPSLIHWLNPRNSFARPAKSLAPPAWSLARPEKSLARPTRSIARPPRRSARPARRFYSPSKKSCSPSSKSRSPAGTWCSAAEKSCSARGGSYATSRKSCSPSAQSTRRRALSPVDCEKVLLDLAKREVDKGAEKTTVVVHLVPIWTIDVAHRTTDDVATTVLDHARIGLSADRATTDIVTSRAARTQQIIGWAAPGTDRSSLGVRKAVAGILARIRGDTQLESACLREHSGDECCRRRSNFSSR